MEQVEEVEQPPEDVDTVQTLELPPKKKVDLDIHILPDEIIRDILILLPARSICRFRSVCRYWNDLLTDPDFLQLRPETSFEVEIHHKFHLHYVPEPLCWSGVNGEIRHHYLQPGKDVQIEPDSISYRCVNDIVCYKCDSKNVYILDKLASKYYVLPANPLTSGFDFELGFDSVSREYKILLWNTSTSESTSEFQFYITTLKISNNTPRVLALGNSSRGKSWRRPLGRVPLLENEIQKSTVTSSGMIYMFEGTKFISFNLETEEFRQIDLPIIFHNEFDTIEHERLVRDEFPNPHHIEGFVYDQDAPFRKFELPSSIYEAYEEKAMCQSNFLYEFFEYEGRLCVVELSTFTSIIGYKHSAIVSMWVLNDERNTWARIMNKTSPPVRGLVGSDIWSRKHSRFSSTKSGDCLLMTAVNDNILYVMIYMLLDRYFTYMEIGPHSQDASCIEV